MKNSVDRKINSDEFEILCQSEKKLLSHISNVLACHKPQKFIYKKTKSRPAAVLIPIFFKNNQAHLLFTKRTDYVEHHKGQISFPGGSRDAADRSLQITALRETEEEVGIKTNDVTILGQTDMFLTNTHFLVTPFVGYYSYPYSYTINDGEIDRLIEIPLLHFLNDETFEIKPYQKDGYNWRVHYYYYGDEVVWGVTGFLLSNFLSIVFGLNRNISEVNPA
ncbi:MAG: CoA pyrophosphatase [Calditrichaceae bacterium]|nr:CoA pyrophosphatase [Calditrichaceae bacterium]